MSRPMKQGPSTRVNGWTQAPARDGDRAVGRVEDRVRVDPGRLVDREPVGRADQGGGREVAVAHADLALGVEVADEVVGVAGDEVPGAVDPLAAELDARRARPPGPRTRRRRRWAPGRRPARARPGAGGLAVAEARPRGRRQLGRPGGRPAGPSGR